MEIDYGKVAPEAMTALGAAHKYLAGTGIDAKLRALVELRVSQINGCAYCMDMHCTQARAAGEAQQRLDVLAGWRETQFFSDRERAALAWAEAVTLQGQTRIAEEAKQSVQAAFSEKEIVDLTVVIAMMNAWNRIAVPLGKSVGRRF